MSYAANALDLCIKEIEQFHSDAYPDCKGDCPAHEAMNAAKDVRDGDDCINCCCCDKGKGVPNLDDCWDDDRKDYEAAFDTLSRYCRVKTQACQARLEGAIEDAISLEKLCEKLYNTLPDWAKW